MTTHISNNISQSSSPTNNGAASASITATSSIVIPAFTNRLQVWVTNTGSKTVYLGLGTTAVANKGIVLTSGQQISFNTFAGAIYAVCGGTDTSTLAFAEI